MKSPVGRPYDRDVGEWTITRTTNPPDERDPSLRSLSGPTDATASGARSRRRAVGLRPIGLIALFITGVAGLSTAVAMGYHPALQSRLFLVLLLALTVAIALATGWAWTRWPRRFAVLGRGLGLLLIAFMGGVVALDELNRAGHFYLSFIDLTGGLASQPSNAVLPAGKGSGTSDLTVLTPNWQREGERLAAAGRGELLKVSIRGGHSRLDWPALIYLPPEYFLSPTVRFPTVELVHGFLGRPRDWVDVTGVNGVNILDEERRAKRMPPVIAVMPTASIGPSTECVDAVKGARVETYLADDLPQAVTSSLRVLSRNSWAIAGVSTGGFCAANLALHHPERYAAAVSFSGYFNAAQDPGTARLYHHDLRALNRNSPIWVIAHYRPPGPPLFVMASSGDPDGVRAQQDLLSTIQTRDRAFPVTATMLPGGHNFGVWRASLPAALDWAGAFLPAPVAPPLQLPLVQGRGHT